MAHHIGESEITAGRSRFQDRFLENLHAAFKKRRKAISHHGELEFHGSDDDEFEWMTIVFSAPGSPSVVLQLIEGNRANLYVRSTSNRARAKILIRMEGLMMLDNPVRVVETFEWTLTAIRHLDRDRVAVTTSVEDRWRGLTLSVS